MAYTKYGRMGNAFKHLKNDSLASIALRKIDPLWSGTIHASNESGFSALPAGRRQANGSFIFEGTETDFWSSDESSLAGSAKAITLKGSFDGISRIDWGKIMDLVADVLKIENSIDGEGVFYSTNTNADEALLVSIPTVSVGTSLQ